MVLVMIRWACCVKNQSWDLAVRPCGRKQDSARLETRSWGIDDFLSLKATSRITELSQNVYRSRESTSSGQE